jgi:hypothetical protein
VRQGARDDQHTSPAAGCGLCYGAGGCRGAVCVHQGEEERTAAWVAPYFDSQAGGNEDGRMAAAAAPQPRADRRSARFTCFPTAH